MTSDRKIQAARQNAQRSTGPRTRLGKRRSSRNALKHGLTVALPRHELASSEARELSEELICDTGAARERLRPYAEDVALAEMDLMRIHSVRKALWTRFEGASQGISPEEGPSGGDLLQGLERLERYAARAMTRRKKAIRRFLESAGA